MNLKGRFNNRQATLKEWECLETQSLLISVHGELVVTNEILFEVFETMQVP